MAGGRIASKSRPLISSPLAKAAPKIEDRRDEPKTVADIASPQDARELDADTPLVEIDGGERTAQKSRAGCAWTQRRRRRKVLEPGVGGKMGQRRGDGGHVGFSALSV